VWRVVQVATLVYVWLIAVESRRNVPCCHNLCSSSGVSIRTIVLVQQVL
jgi:hypothetical protein